MDSRVMARSIAVFMTALLCHLATNAGAMGQQPTYWKDIRPIFRKYCTVCHSARHADDADVSGGLALDSYEAVRKGTVHPVIQPGKSANSVLVRRLETTNKRRRMPLDADPLPPEAITLIRAWIDRGAPAGTKPAETTPAVATRQSRSTRRLEVIVPTQFNTPAGVLGKTGGTLELRWRIGPLAPVTGVAFSPDNKLLAVGTYGQAVIWDLTGARPIKFLTNVLGAVNDVRFSPDGQLLAVAGGQPSARGDLRLYRTSDWKLMAALRGHEDVVFSVDFSRDGRRLASASFDKTVRIWNLARFEQERVLGGHSDFVYAVKFSPDGKRIVSTSKDRTVKLVDADTGQSLFTFSGMEQDVLSAAVSPDGKHVVSAGFETALHWWNPETGERTKLQGGHGVAVNELCFSADGSRLVSAGSDQTVRLWNGKTGGLMRTISVGSIVYAVAISSNNKLVASGSFDGLARIWDEASGRLQVIFLGCPEDAGRHDWLALTPEGYAAGSPEIASRARWYVAGQEVAGGRVWPVLNRPEMIVRAARGDKPAAPKFGK
jgi:dipeptidyl aminopeptidase/acylaminoacyl peptidase